METKAVLTRTAKFIRKHFIWFPIVFFAVWILFLSEYSVVRYYKLKEETEEMKSAVKYYKKRSEENLRQLQIMENDYYLEKYAREKYFMKRPDEDVFIFEEMPSQSN
jgi:cell division protein FtsB